MELNFLILEFLVFCATMEAADMTFRIKEVHVELNFSKIEFCTIFFPSKNGTSFLTRFS